MVIFTEFDETCVTGPLITPAQSCVRTSLPMSYPSCPTLPSRSCLPSTQSVSVNFHDEIETQQEETEKVTHLATIIGQFLEHDIAFTPELEPQLDCCQVPTDKEEFTKFIAVCFPFDDDECKHKMTSGGIPTTSLEICDKLLKFSLVFLLLHAARLLLILSYACNKIMRIT